MLQSLLFFLLISPSHGIEFKKMKLKFENGKTLVVEIADTHEKRTQGLMNRTSLEENQGMLFIFDRSQALSFWMKNTYIPLSIAYFDKNKIFKEMYEMKAQNMMEKVQNTNSYPSQCQCLYALEVNQGWYKKNKIKKESSFQLAPLSSKVLTYPKK